MLKPICLLQALGLTSILDHMSELLDFGARYKTFVKGVEKSLYLSGLFGYFSESVGSIQKLL